MDDIKLAMLGNKEAVRQPMRKHGQILRRYTAARRRR